ncbi:hypothetical protein DNTS_004381 [Danionella cerebrum]|uniref:Uncharacterized protein n=1 Tax=Danionella cerebrum TaxID=2873325 RepID=A0A553RNM5_9TELE|nr:hypothetical protein DNTS_004381 [Danionella translucida]
MGFPLRCVTVPNVAAGALSLCPTQWGWVMERLYQRFATCPTQQFRGTLIPLQWVQEEKDMVKSKMKQLETQPYPKKEVSGSPSSSGRFGEKYRNPMEKMLSQDSNATGSDMIEDFTHCCPA